MNLRTKIQGFIWTSVWKSIWKPVWNSVEPSGHIRNIVVNSVYNFICVSVRDKLETYKF